MKYKLTIVTTTYNHEKFIEEALNGFVNQKTTFPFQVLISDDCSTDNTAKIIRKYQKKYPNIIKPIFRKKNLGPMENFIETLNEVHTTYVALCDGDDYWTDENKLQKQVDFLDKNKNYTICFHQTEIFYEADKNKKELCYPKNVKDTTDFNDLIKECYIPANSVVYRWQFLKSNSFKKKFPQNIVPGDYYVHLLHASNGKIKFINEPMSKYRKHEGGMWWTATDETQKSKFYLKYGIKYINFFEALEKEFKLKKSQFEYTKKYLIENTFACLISEKRWKEIELLDNKYGKIITNYVKNIRTEPIYYNFTKFKRIIYYLIFEPKTFKNKVLLKLKKL